MVQSLCTAKYESAYLTKNDYQNDRAICLTSVIFPDSDLAEHIAKKLIAPLAQIEPCHFFYQPESLHITIKNIRTAHYPPLFTETDQTKADLLFRETIPCHKSFTFTLEEIAALPGGVSLIGYSSKKFSQLITGLDAGLSHAGLPDNKEYVSDTVYFGNMTLCRYTKPPSDTLLKQILRIKKITPLKIKAETVSLITCNRICDPRSRNIINSYNLSR